nr:hypothetical protein Q903MT_gene2612 [Picea sitchensis]
MPPHETANSNLSFNEGHTRRKRFKPIYLYTLFHPTFCRSLVESILLACWPPLVVHRLRLLPSIQLVVRLLCSPPCLPCFSLALLCSPPWFLHRW